MIALQEAGQQKAPSELPPEPPRTADYVPMRLMPNGTGFLLMASYLYALLPSALAYIHPSLGSYAGRVL